MKKIVSLLLLFTFGLSSCEKDDICDGNTPTTPRLIITFYNISDPSVVKNVTNLKVVGIGGGDPNGIIFNDKGTDTGKYLANGSTISIPLKTDGTTTAYSFIFNAINTNPAAVNTDVLTFNYTTQNIYVSRACGFKTNFTLNPSDNSNTAGIIRTDPANDGQWMQSIDILTPNIQTENETHVKIYF